MVKKYLPHGMLHELERLEKLNDELYDLVKGAFFAGWRASEVYPNPVITMTDAVVENAYEEWRVLGE